MGPKKKKAKDSLFMTDEELEEQEEAKKKAEQERLEKERLLKELEEELRKAKVEKRKREKTEIKCEEFRNQLLQEHCSEFLKFRTEYLDYLIERRREKEWQVYVSCNHLPFANDPPALNTFLYTWNLIEDKLNMDNVLPESEIILETVKPVQTYIDTPLDINETTVKNLREVKLNYYDQVQKNIDKVTFDAIMDLGKYHKHVETSQLEIFRESENLMIWLWSWAVEGRSAMKPRKKRPERKLPMMSFTLPGILDVKRYHLRIFYTSYDPYSFQSASYYGPKVSCIADLYEETVNIRKMEVHALKLRYMNNYDEDIMPWWFLMDKEIMEDKAKKDLLKKPKQPKKKKGLNQVDSVINVKASETETTKISLQNSGEDGNVEEKPRKKSQKIIEDVTGDEHEKERPLLRFSKTGDTQILYSRSMSNLMEERRNECNGPEYFPEPDPIEFLEQSDISSTGSSRERYKDLFKAEKHTTFKACLYNEDDCLSDAVILRDINDCLNRNDPSEERLSLTDRRVFLDWKSFRDISPDREAIRGELEDLLFGDTEMIIDNGEVKYVKRNTQLRSIKDLLSNIVSTKGSVGNIPELTEVQEKEQEGKDHNLNIQQMEGPIKVTNVTEMKAVEMDIANILDIAWQDSMDVYVKKMMLPIEPGSINMRQIVIIGGVFHFDFFEDEPQPVVNKDSFKTQLHYGKFELKPVLFDQVPKVKIDLAAEAERQMNLAKRQKSLRKMSRLTFSEPPPEEDSDSVVIGDDDLVWISLKLPKNKIYFETPIPVRWNSDKMCWTTDDVYDNKWSEKTYTCNFKLGKSGPFAIATFRFTNLPYFKYSMKPSLDWRKNPEIELMIITRNLHIRFKIKEEIITIEKLDHPRAEFVSHIINIPFTLEELVVAMRSCGIDIFPEWDSFLYINISLKKLKTLEEHMYYCMGFSAPAFEYASSYHNSGSRDDRIYVQLRECVDKNVPVPKFRTILANPFKVIFVNPDKVSYPTEESEEGMGYTPDLKYLTEVIASRKAFRRMKKASRRTTGTLISLLTATKILSYS